MKTDVNGCSITVNGQENYERFYSVTAKRDLVQYDYRTENGELFSCIAPTLEKCREKRDIWLNE